MEENEKLENFYKSSVEEQPTPKRRKRRTKAEIEADKAKEAAEKAIKEAAKAAVEKDKSTDTAKEDVESLEVVQNKSQVETPQDKLKVADTDSQHCDTEVENNELESAKFVPDRNPEDSQEEISTQSESTDVQEVNTEVEQHVEHPVNDNEFDFEWNFPQLVTVPVFKSPVKSGTYSRNMRIVATPKSYINGFIQIEYMKTGYGLVTGYVPVEQFISAL